MRLPCISTLVDLAFSGIATFSDAYLDEGRKALQNSRNRWLLALPVIFVPRCNELGRLLPLRPPTIATMTMASQNNSGSAGTPYRLATATGLPVDGYASLKPARGAARRIFQVPQEHRIDRPPTPVYPSMGMPRKSF